MNNGKKTWGKYGKTVSITLKGTDVKNGSDSDIMVERALKKLKMPDEKKTKLDSTITFSEYTEILSNIISEYRPKLATKWKKIVSAASKSKEKMDVEDGYLMLSYLWVLCGYNNGYGQHIRWWERWAGEDDEKRSLQMEYLSWNYPLFPDWETIAYPDYNSNYMWGAVTVFPDEVSPVDGSNMFVYDEKNNSLHLNEALTWRTAIRAAQCMSEILAYDTYVPTEEIKCLVTDESIKLEKRCPKLHGTIFPSGMVILLPNCQIQIIVCLWVV